MDYSHPTLLTARRLAQSLGFARPLLRIYRRLTGERYEQDFDEALLSDVRSGDVVWDVGANVGIYTEKFARLVGPEGFVIAFEPTPSTVEILKRNLSYLPQVQIEGVALSTSSSTANFVISEGHVTNSLSLECKAGTVIQVPVMRGDDYKGRRPSIIKIDVEGFESEVLSGLKGLMRDSGLRGIYIEVHFLELKKRGIPNAPAEIVANLKDEGFDVRWVDASHIAATRPSSHSN